MDSQAGLIHPVWLRMTHWVNAIAVIVLATSGWRIYNASPFMGFSFPVGVTLGGWLGGAIQWHFAAMWLLVGNGLVYFSFNTIGGRLARQFFPVSPRAVLADARAALMGRLSHADPGHYNAVQRAAYLLVMLDSVLLVLSGLVLWKSVQFPWLRALLGGFEVARRVHFVGMAAMVSFVGIHLVMVARFPRTLLAMIRGH